MKFSKKVQRLFSVLLAIIIALLSAPNTVFAVVTDTAGPVIIVVSCDRQKETLYEGDTITLTFRLEDPSGIGSNVGMLMTYRDPNGQNYREFGGPACRLNTTTGLYECKFTVSASHKVGTYVFAKLHAYDTLGNYSYIRPACSFVVAGTETDTAGPTITEISCDKANAYLYEGDSIKYTFKLEDPSGIGSNVGMLMTYRDPDGQNYREFGGPACIYNPDTGLYECVFTVSASHKVGTYEFAKLHAYDQLGNLSYFRPDKYFYVREVKRPITFGGHSTYEDVSGLAFRFDVNVQGMDLEPDNATAIYDHATVDGNKLLGMGAVVTNGYDTRDVQCVYLFGLTETSASFAVRIINIPHVARNEDITATPYIIVEIDGVATTIYGEAQTTSYNSALA